MNCFGQISLFDPKPDKPVCFRCGGEVTVSDLDDLFFECECDKCNIVFWERKSKYKGDKV